MDQGYSQDDMRRLFDKLRPISDAAITEATDIARVTRDMPEKLFHYTDTAALMGIVENQEIWATDANFLNDESELIWASKIFHSVISQIKPADQGEETLFERMKIASDIRERGQSFFLASFSEQPDDLAQWRGYGTGKAPVCLGFNTKRLIENYPYCELLSVIYDKDQQTDIASRIVEIVLNMYRGNKDSDNPASADHYTPHCVMTFASMVGYAGLRFKSSHWQSEREWRLVAVPDPSELMRPPYPPVQDCIKFRAGPNNIVPYMKLKPVLGPTKHPLPITDVITGPTGYRDLAAKSLYTYLRANRYTYLESLTASSVSLR